MIRSYRSQRPAPLFPDDARRQGTGRRRRARVRSAGRAVGHVSTPEALGVAGLGFSAWRLATLLQVDSGGRRRDLEAVRTHDAVFADRLPPALDAQLEMPASRLGTS